MGHKATVILTLAAVFLLPAASNARQHSAAKSVPSKSVTRKLSNSAQPTPRPTGVHPPPTAHHHAHAVVHDLLGGGGHSHQPRGTLAVNAHTGHRHRAAGTQGDLAGDVAAGGTLVAVDATR